MNKSLKEVRRKIGEVTEWIVAGKAADYAAYATLVGRYRVLKELELFLLDPKNSAAEDIEDVDVDRPEEPPPLAN